jgi:ATP-binding cassette subfamily B protein
VHTARNSSVVISGIVDKINGATAVLVAVLNLSSSVVLLVTVTVALIAMEPMVATLTAIGFGAGYAAIISPARRQLKRNSDRIAQLQTRILKSVQEGLGGIRDVLLDCSQDLHSAIYREADLPLRRALGVNSFIGQSPRHATEALGMIIIAVISYGLIRTGSLVSALPTLALLALGAQRLLPALQLAYAAWVGIAGSQASLVAALELLDQRIPEEYRGPTPEPLSLNESLRFESLGFRYQEGGPWVIKNVNLTIRKGSRVGFVGGSGSGKSTLIDITLGLLTPTQGMLLVDGVPLERRNLRGWQREIAHVPQSIFLSDSTFTENIAFAVPKDRIDPGKIREAARQAQIAEFIESRPQGYETPVGERGVQLSGGQRQRIGIARALYKDAKILVLDEATAALDSATERSVMRAIDELNRELTILIVAHRISTVRNCDMIVEIENGRIVAHGTYDELLAKSGSFRSIAGA